VRLRSPAVLGSVIALAVVPASACASFGTASDDAPNKDASTDDGGGGDATAALDAIAPDAATARCDLTKPFKVAPLLGMINTETDNESYAALSDDERTIYFGRGAGSARDIWRASRKSRDDVFGTPQKFDSVNSVYLDDGLTLSRDGLFGVFASGRPSGGAPDLYFSKRTTPEGAFPTPMKIPGTFNSGVNDNDPYLVTDLGKMYFASDREASFDIYVVSVNDMMFGEPTKVSELSSSFSDGAPVASVDDMEIFIATGRQGGSNERAYHARRPAPGMAFDAPVDVPELNEGTSSAIPSWLSPDRCVLYFSSDRDGTRDIFVATRGK
jgi:hypothetical protein